nr:MAG TPA: hypothetical protein [Caudoviricetes sp.]DAN01349.1 MAG TPA: hypothetical protein [Caudoviricetes sp.]DAR89742.1 MAG TPA: hypothetical protein [Caudoviricetes sp.]
MFSPFRACLSPTLLTKKRPAKLAGLSLLSIVVARYKLTYSK